MSHRRLIIPVFIPFGGCPHQCVFCDQRRLTGGDALPSVDEVAGTIEAYLATWKGKGPREAAFYGGSFTGLPRQLQQEYLEAAVRFVREGRLDALRISTRPDYIDAETARFLKSMGVATIELGVQSMDDRVLALSKRGHTAGATVAAVEALRSEGLSIGLQFMPGLPGDTRESVLETTRAVIGLRPDFVRVYPAIVIKDTPMHGLYLSGLYRPWPLDEMVEACAGVKRLLDMAGVPVIRMGLQATEGLERSIAAGPYHPSFRQLVDAALAIPRV